MYKVKTKFCNSILVTSVFDSNKVEVYRNQYMFDQIREDWTYVEDWKIKMYVPPIPANVGRFVIYIYNPQKGTHYFPKIECKLAEIYEGSKDYSTTINP